MNKRQTFFIAALEAAILAAISLSLLLVPLTLKAGTFEPQDAEAFEKGLATGVNRLMADEALRTRMGVAGRMRAEKHFSWSSIAAKTHQLYVELVETKKSPR